MENRLLKELLELIKQRPDLPIIPMVDSEIVCDDSCSRWMGSWGSCYIGEYINGEERLHFREEDDLEEIEEALTDGAVTCEDFEAMSDEEAKGAYDSLPWIKAIIVDIDLPE